jgi:hypothetical protein
MDIFLEWVGSTVSMSRREATEVFSEWAEKGKDKGMENGHAASVHAMLELGGIPVQTTIRPSTLDAVTGGFADCLPKMNHALEFSVLMAQRQ